MDKTCKTCKWWGEKLGSTCARECTLAMLEWDHDADEYDPESFGVAKADDGRVVPVFTGPDFGCIHHENRRQPNG